MAPPQIQDILAALALRRPVFHSEADFQHALAWQIQLTHPKANVRLEKQVSADGVRVHLDLLVQEPSYELAIELKYKTRATTLIHAEETFSLRNQSAQDVGRHDFLKDIQRLERYTQGHPGSTGYAVLVTNDRTYWNLARKTNAVDSEFRLHEGRVVEGGVTWGAMASAGTKHKREATIMLAGKYKMVWSDYSSPGQGNAGTFRYVLLRVPSDG